jgi:hypothetical protein
MRKYYTYRIGWSDLDLYYYGVRTCNKWEPEEDLWKYYFTSSKSVHILREEYKEPDIIEVRQRFDSRIKAKMWESEVIRRLCYHSHRYLNSFPRNFFDVTK